ncbi:MAG: hypothetical protein EZS28_040681 [Streblomastix strix]|uniref:Calcineurin-like phosphoesterase domain-containing protein n=1 Tax=Streblomastix strix TaxID=222440 RepID=A0A5J4U0N4_9EUKA|nr:MAG: hypothetical protein EZS28_040681 [Streblomastix strix]
MHSYRRSAEILSIVRYHAKAKVHLHGHRHICPGTSYDGQTLFINSAICDIYNHPSSPAIVFDYPQDDVKRRKHEEKEKEKEDEKKQDSKEVKRKDEENEES